MPRTKEERETWELQCYGCSQYEIQIAVEGAAKRGRTSLGGIAMLAASILSDAQTLLEMGGDTNTVRQYMNRSKHIIFEHLSGEGDN